VTEVGRAYGVGPLPGAAFGVECSDEVVRFIGVGGYCQASTDDDGGVGGADFLAPCHLQGNGCVFGDGAGVYAEVAAGAGPGGPVLCGGGLGEEEGEKEGGEF